MARARHNSSLALPRFGLNYPVAQAISAGLGHCDNRRAQGTNEGVVNVHGKIGPLATLRESEAAQPQARGRRSLVLRCGIHLRGLVDRLIASSSLVANGPLLDVRDFAWTQCLRENWRAIRDEATAVTQHSPAPPLSSISPHHWAVAPRHTWRSFFLWRHGSSIDENLGRCPVTSATIAKIPHLDSAFFSILAPGAHIPPHRGVTKGLITCHLGLIVPRDGDARMRVADRIVRWSEGETLIFDDTYDHEAWNDTAHIRVVLLLQFRRPLRNPGKWIADAFLNILRRSVLVQEAHLNVLAWNAATTRIAG